MRVVDAALARRLEEAEAADWASLLEGLAGRDGNRYGAEVRRFGQAIALVCPGMPERSFVNRVLLAADPEEVDAALHYFHSLGLRCRVDVTPFDAGPMLAHLAKRGFRQGGFQMALYLDLREVPPPARPDYDVRVAVTREMQEFVAQAVPVAFGDVTPPWPKWLADSAFATFDRPDWQTYVAFIDDEPAAFAQLHVDRATGCLAIAGTLPNYRGRGAQTALIRERLAASAAAGCDLVCCQTGNGTVSQHNLERAGFRIAYTKAEFYA